MKLPAELFLSSIKEKSIYYFSTTYISSEEPHFFICLKRTDEDILIMSCCTSQFENQSQFIISRSLPYETLVWINPGVENDENPFKKDTYINCNNSFTYTIEEFRTMYNSDCVTYSGKISDHHYEQILNGIQMSPLIDDETKDLMPKI